MQIACMSKQGHVDPPHESAYVRVRASRTRDASTGELSGCSREPAAAAGLKFAGRAARARARTRSRSRSPKFGPAAGGVASMEAHKNNLCGGASGCPRRDAAMTLRHVPALLAFCGATHGVHARAVQCVFTPTQQTSGVRTARASFASDRVPATVVDLHAGADVGSFDTGTAGGFSMPDSHCRLRVRVLLLASARRRHV